MIGFRKRHPSLARSRFWRSDVRWFGPSGVVDFSPPSSEVALCLRGGAQHGDDLYFMINAGSGDLAFIVQDVNEAAWRLAVDTGRPSPEDIDVTGSVALPHTSYVVGARSVVVLVRSSG